MMAINPQIPLMAGQGVTPIKSGLDIQKELLGFRNAQQSNQMNQMNIEDRFTQRKQSEATQLQSEAESRQKIQESISRMSESQRKQAFEQVQELGKASEWILSQPPERMQEAHDYAVTTIPGLEKFKGMQVDPNQLQMFASQARAFGKELETVKPMTEIGKLNAELKAGMITRVQYDQEIKTRNAPKQPLVQIDNGKGKPPAGYAWGPDDQLVSIPGGPADKLPEKQNSIVVGTQNLQNAITEYRNQLSGWQKMQALDPSARAEMGVVYNNMMLQAKEAYNLGVLSGPDLQILQSVITDPRSFTGAITPKTALDKQAATLSRIMGDVGRTSSNTRPRVESSPKPPVSGPTATDAKGNKIMWNGTSWVPVK